MWGPWGYSAHVFAFQPVQLILVVSVPAPGLRNDLEI